MVFVVVGFRYVSFFIAQLVVWCSLVTADKVLTWVSRFEGV